MSIKNIHDALIQIYFFLSLGTLLIKTFFKSFTVIPPMLTHWIPDGTLGITHPSRSPVQHQRLYVWSPCRYCSFKLPHKCLKHSSWEFTAISQKALRMTDLVQYLFIQIIYPRILAPSHHQLAYITCFQKICNPDLKASKGWEPPIPRKSFL